MKFNPWVGIFFCCCGRKSSSLYKNLFGTQLAVIRVLFEARVAHKPSREYLLILPVTLESCWDHLKLIHLHFVTQFEPFNNFQSLYLLDINFHTFFKICSWLTFSCVTHVFLMSDLFLFGSLFYSVCHRISPIQRVITGSYINRRKAFKIY